MVFYIPFGDWSNDGHGMYENLLVEAPSMEYLLEAQKEIKKKYGNGFFNDFADKYGDSSIGKEVIQALKDSNYDFNKYFTEEDILKNPEIFDELDLEVIEDMFIHLLNSFGAEIKVIDQPQQINNWTCEGFETVGYGCFYE